jgi:hypothetical protein
MTKCVKSRVNEALLLAVMSSVPLRHVITLEISTHFAAPTPVPIPTLPSSKSTSIYLLRYRQASSFYSQKSCRPTDSFFAGSTTGLAYKTSQLWRQREPLPTIIAGATGIR